MIDSPTAFPTSSATHSSMRGCPCKVGNPAALRQSSGFAIPARAVWVDGIKKTKAKTILSEVSAAIADWRTHAEKAGISQADTARIGRTHRRELFV